MNDTAVILAFVALAVVLLLAMAWADGWLAK